MIFSIAWKNIWRNPLRSMIVIMAIAIGVMAGAFMIALMQGWIQQRSKDAIYVESSHIQIHAQEYRQNEDPKFRISNASEVEDFILSQPETKAVASRTQVLAMATAGYKASGFILRGIKPEKEKQVSELYRLLKDSSGCYLDCAEKKRPLFLSERTAKDLRLQQYKIDQPDISMLQVSGLPSEVIDSLQTITGKVFRNKIRLFRSLKQLLTEQTYVQWKDALEKQFAFFRLNKKVQLTVRSLDGNEVSSVFRVAGIFRTSNAAFDTKYAYVLDQDLRALTAWPDDEYHEIAVLANNMDDVEILTNKIQQKFPELDVQSWRELLPDIAMYADMMTVYATVFMAIILFALGFGIVNTMLMVVLERTKELGMLMAIGMSKRRVFFMVIVETVLLSVVGGVLGMIIGMLLVHLFSITGIDLSAFAEGMEAMGFAAVIYPEMELFYYVEIALLVVCTGILSAIYPARKAVALIPADAVRTE